jgi:hypothetical protein
MPENTTSQHHTTCFIQLGGSQPATAGVTFFSTTTLHAQRQPLRALHLKANHVPLAKPFFQNR